MAENTRYRTQGGMEGWTFDSCDHSAVNDTDISAYIYAIVASLQYSFVVYAKRNSFNLHELL